MSSHHHHPGCIFCKIVRGEIPSTRVLESADAIAFLDIQPVNRGHVLIVPRAHYADLAALPDHLASHVAGHLPKLCRAVRAATGADGLNVIVLFVFAVALMGDVLTNTISRPLLVLSLLALATLVTFGLCALTALLLFRVDVQTSLPLAHAAASRNTGLMLAAAAGAIPGFNEANAPFEDLGDLYDALHDFFGTETPDIPGLSGPVAAACDALFGG